MLNLELQYKMHKHLEPQDLIKLVFQASFGPYHLLNDENSLKNYFYKEYEAVKEEDGIVFEEISDDYVRVNLAQYKYNKLDPEKLYYSFIESIKESNPNNYDYFNKSIDEVKEYLYKFENKKQYDDFVSFLNIYLNDGIKAVHHSNNYQKNENPHYRVILKKFIEKVK